MAASQLQTSGILMSFTSGRIQTIGILSFLLFCGTCFAQKKATTTINRDNYYSYLLPNEKVFYLTEGEIKIILDGELKTLGIAQKNWHAEFVLIGKEKPIVDKTKQGKVIAWIWTPIPVYGIYLEQSKLSFQRSENFSVNVDTAVFKLKEASDPIELPYQTIKQSRYWYQQKKETQKTEVVSRSVIVEILREDIKLLTAAIKKK